MIRSTRILFDASGFILVALMQDFLTTLGYVAFPSNQLFDASEFAVSCRGKMLSDIILNREVRYGKLA